MSVQSRSREKPTLTRMRLLNVPSCACYFVRHSRLRDYTHTAREETA